MMRQFASLIQFLAENDLTPHQRALIRVEIAKIHGYTEIVSRGGTLYGYIKTGADREDPDIGRYQPVPDYLLDYNPLIEIEKRLTEDQYRSYENALSLCDRVLHTVEGINEENIDRLSCASTYARIIALMVTLNPFRFGEISMEKEPPKASEVPVAFQNKQNSNI